MIKIQIINIKLQNIRNYDDLEISFTNGDSPYTVTLLQMPNGTGKTTASTLLRYLFSGKEVPENEVFEFKPKNSDIREGKAWLTVVVSDSIHKIENETYTVELSLNYDTGRSSYYTTSISRYGGRTAGHKLPNAAKFDYDLTKLFVFDGELVEELIKKDESTAESILDMLYGLDKISDLSAYSVINGDKVFEDSKVTISTTQGIKQQRTTLKKLEDVKEKLENTLNNAHSERTKCINKLEIVKKELEEKTDEKTKIELETINKNISRLTEDIKDDTSKLFKNTTPIPILSKPLFGLMQQLREKMDILKLPKSTASDFFDEMVTQEYCICGHKMTDEMRINITENAKKYLSEEMQSVMNAVKTSIKDNESIDTYNFDSNRIKIDEEVRDLSRLQMEKQKTEFKNKGNKTEEIINLSKQMNDLESLISDIEFSIESYTDPDFEGADENNNLPICEEHIKSIKSKLLKSDSAIRRREKAYELSKMYTEIHDLTLSKLKDIIKTSTNEKLKKVLKNDGIEINSIDKSIILSGQSSASEAQKLSVGYTYIMSLFENSLYDMPFIIDSPCGSLDLKNRRQIANLIPNIFNQTIMFITSSERQDFADYLLKMPNTKAYTIYKNKNSNNKIEMSEDLEFFNQYQDNEEEDE